jgi:hypothetical protein
MVGDVWSRAEVRYKDALHASPCWKLPAYKLSPTIPAVWLKMERGPKWFPEPAA